MELTWAIPLAVRLALGLTNGHDIRWRQQGHVNLLQREERLSQKITHRVMPKVRTTWPTRRQMNSQPLNSEELRSPIEWWLRTVDAKKVHAEQEMMIVPGFPTPALRGSQLACTPGKIRSLVMCMWPYIYGPVLERRTVSIIGLSVLLRAMDHHSKEHQHSGERRFYERNGSVSKTCLKRLTSLLRETFVAFVRGKLT